MLSSVVSAACIAPCNPEETVWLSDSGSIADVPVFVAIWLVPPPRTLDMTGLASRFTRLARDTRSDATDGRRLEGERNTEEEARVSAGEDGADEAR